MANKSMVEGQELAPMEPWRPEYAPQAISSSRHPASTMVAFVLAAGFGLSIGGAFASQAGILPPLGGNDSAVVVDPTSDPSMDPSADVAVDPTTDPTPVAAVTTSPTEAPAIDPVPTSGPVIAPPPGGGGIDDEDDGDDEGEDHHDDGDEDGEEGDDD